MRWVALLLCMTGLHAAFGDAAYVDYELKLVFPAKLGGMDCEKVEKYNNEDLGFSLFYQRGDQFDAEVSVYNLGRPSIETGHDVDGIDIVIRSVEDDYKRREEGAAVSNVRKRGTMVVPKKGEIQFSNTVFQYLQPRGIDGRTNNVPRILSVYATAAHNHFFKIQFSFDVAGSKDARLMADRMVQELSTTIKGGLSEEELLLAACTALIRNPADYGGRAAAQLVLAQSQTMDNLNIYPHLFAWPDGYRKPKNANLLIAAYFAGMIQVVVPQKLEAGGECEGFIAMLSAYESLRKNDQIESIPDFDEWVKAADKKALFQELLYAPVE
ncbi:hypothetical protein PDESU_05912 [Pontiella desulfatans]|uniref:Uncharacterized protein n=1 Tax=Pontiella desulfatans TaxID=2750659 RepID=A0A6C2UDM6_PONDE|nr:hypothetical protein [Pontiella desulfatans]VGO17316.1 hypothetical protein PDESU_05912 [Pontiella desulfatans]